MLANDNIAHRHNKPSPKYHKWDRKWHRQLLQQFRQTGDKDFLEQIYREYENLVVNLAQKFATFSASFEDLKQVGAIALIMAAKRYNPDYNVEFSSYATPCIIGEIKKYFRNKTWSFKALRQLMSQKLQIKPTPW